MFVELDNATLTNIEGFQSPNPDLTLTINRSDLEVAMMGKETLEQLIADGTAKTQGNVAVLKQLASLMVDFGPRFQIMPGTAIGGVKMPHVAAFQAEDVVHADPYEAVPRQTIAE